MTARVLLRKAPGIVSILNKDVLPDWAVFLRHNEITGLDEYILPNKETPNES